MFSALNDSSDSENDETDPEVLTREIQEEEAYSLYKSALTCMCGEKYDEARNKLKEVLELPFLFRVPLSREKSSIIEKGLLSPPLKLKYLVFKNLAVIANKQKNYEAAAAAYLEALEIDPTDVCVWYEMGTTALHIFNYPLARLAFDEGYRRYPNHWPCLDNLITVTYALNDYANCLYYIARGLEKECGYVKALAFKDRIFEEFPYLKEFCAGYFNCCNPIIHVSDYDKDDAEQFISEALDLREKKRSLIKSSNLPVIHLKYSLKEYTWKALGESLIATYDHINSSEKFISFSSEIKLTDAKSKKTALEEKNPSLLVEIHDPSGQQELPDDKYLSDQQLNSSIGDHHGTGGDYPSKMEVDEVTNGEINILSNTYSLPIVTTTDTGGLQLDPLFYTDASFGNKRIPKRKPCDVNEKSGKRRSMRVRNPTTKRHQDNVNYQELLQQFLPPRLHSEVTEDIDKDNGFSPVTSSGDHTYGQTAESTKRNEKKIAKENVNNLTSSEKEEVEIFVSSNRTNGGIIDLMYKYVIKLGTESNSSWPKALLDVFSAAFLRLRKHIVMPNLFCCDVDVDYIKDTGIAVLTFSELKVDQWYLSTGHSSSSSSSFSPKLPYAVPSFQIGPDSIGKNFHADMEFLMQLAVRRDVLADAWLDFVVRTLWLKAKFHSVEGEVDMAVSCLDRLVDVLQKEEKTDLKVVISNSYFSNVITMSNVQQQLELLQRCQSLEEVQRLYDRGAYQAVIDLLTVTFRPTHSSTQMSVDGSVPERHAQLILLQDSLLKLKKHQECVQWTEVAFNEALQQFMNAPTMSARNDWSDTMIHLLSGLESCFQINGDLLNGVDALKLARFSQNLILLICILMESCDTPSESSLTVLPWIVLYRLILNEELCNSSVSSGKKPGGGSSHSAVEKTNGRMHQPKSTIAAANMSLGTNVNTTMPTSIMLLLTAHECLGRRSYCCAANGLFLLHCVDVMMAQLQNSSKESRMYREDLEHGLEQCFYCLYGHPSKRTKAKHLQEHNSQQITLTWKRAVQIYQYFKPDILPEFDSYRTSTVSAELENLLKRIAALVPSEQDPSNHVDAYTAYIEGGVESCPTFPQDSPPQNIVVKDLYYLLGDFYFKNKEFSKANRYYLLDICINPDRQDSWAGMALSRSSQLEQKINSYEVKNEGTVYRKSSAALRCFEHALQLNSYTTSLWIEYGSLAYVLHSHASRQLKQGSYFDGPRDLLKNKRDEMLLLAERCFREANKSDDGSDPDEAWLHHYMLGKIAQKQRSEPSVFLDHFQKSLMYIHEDGARYPPKVAYHNPPDLAIDVLEVYYRIHASCLKILMKHENSGMSEQKLRPIRECLLAVRNGPFAKFQEKTKSKSSQVSESDSENGRSLSAVIKTRVKISAEHNYTNKRCDASTLSVFDDNKSSDNIVVLNHIIQDLVNSIVTSVSHQVSHENLVVEVSPEVKAASDKVTIDSKNSFTSHDMPPIVCNSSQHLLMQIPAKEMSVKTSVHVNMEDIIAAIDSIVGKIDAVCSEVEGCARSKGCEHKKLNDLSNEDFDCVLTVFNEMLHCIQHNKEYIPFKSETPKMSIAEATVKRKLKVNKLSDSEKNINTKIFDELCNKIKESTPSAAVMDFLATKKASLLAEKSIIETGHVLDNADLYQENCQLCKSSSYITSDVQSSSKKSSNDASLSKDPLMEHSRTSTEKMVQEMHTPQEEKFSSVFSFLHNDSSRVKNSKEEREESKAVISELIYICLDGLRECLRRFIQHYKSLYRMAYYYYHSSKNRNIQWAREILLAATPAVKNYASMPGLFAERKNTNFFNNIWRLPSTEIDRPGSFGAHMFRSVRLLIDVLSHQKDYNMLLYLTLQLYKTPDMGKRYMRDAERVLLTRESYCHCVTILREQMNSLLQEEPPPEESRLTCCLLEIYRTYQSLTKSCIFPEDTNELLEEAYRMYKLGEVDPNPSVLQQAITFCQRQLGKSYQPNMKPMDISVYRST